MITFCIIFPFHLPTAVERRPKLQAIDTSASSFSGNVGDTRSLIRRNLMPVHKNAGVNDLTS